MKQKDDVEKMKIKPNELNKTINGLRGGFLWKHSKEGARYWNKIYRRLNEIREKGR